MYNENLDHINIDIVNKDLPDRDIEIFWYSWKNILYNAFKKKETIINSFDLIQKSLHLNKLQGLCEYSNIQLYIQQSLENHVILAIENYIDTYHCNILETHLKRWDKITKSYSNLNNTDIKNYSYNFRLFSLYKLILNEKKQPDFEKTILLDNIIEYKFNTIVDYAIIINKGNILDKILALSDISEHLMTKYNTTYIKGSKGNKILKKIKQINDTS